MKIRIYHNPIKKTEENENRVVSAGVIRGGSWNFFAGRTRVAFRGFQDPTFRFYNFGFRIAKNESKK